MDEDGEFEVTAEMLIHGDVDDEQTLVEEEALETTAEVEEEMADLQQESELPLDELLKRYGYAFPGESHVEDTEGEREEGEREEGGEEREEGEEEGKEQRGVSSVKRARVDESDRGREEEEEEEEGESEEERSAKKRVKVAAVSDRSGGEGGVERRIAIKRSEKSSDRKENSTDGKGQSERSEDNNCRRNSTNTVTAVTNSSAIIENNSHTCVCEAECICPDVPSQPLPKKRELSDVSLPSSTPSDSLCSRKDNDCSPVVHVHVGSQDESRAAATLDSPVNSSLFPTRTSSLALGQPLLPEEVSVSLDCDGRLGDSGYLLEDLGGGGKGGGGRKTGKRKGGDVVVNSFRASSEGGGVDVFHDGGGDGLLITGILGNQVEGDRGRGEGSGVGGERSGEVERLPGEVDEYRTDHTPSSDIRVHTPSISSSVSLQATSCVGEGVRVRSSRADIKSRLRPEVPERRSMRLMANDEKALDSYFSAFFDDDDGDDEYLPIEDWKQDIRVGSSYQVEVDDRPSCQPYSSQPDTSDRLLWRPQHADDKVVSYLKSVSTVRRPGSANSSWDTEQALQLLQDCDHNVQRAIDVVHEQGLPAGTKPWTEEECKNFEQGLRVSGKDFFQLKQQVPSRTVRELVEFYYFWKKSKRYDNFIQQGKIGKKKISFQPGQVSDFMDNYLNMQDPEATDLHYATTTVYAEHKKEAL